MKKLGFILNPIAGMGGKVGLKGSDGLEILKEAIKRGAIPESANKAKQALAQLRSIKDEFELWTAPHDMGEAAALEMGFSPKVIPLSIEAGRTTPLDTMNAVKKMLEMKVDLLLFAGGDGTARNICKVNEDVIPVIGIPAGVKIHSAVYATNPANAGESARKFLTGNITKTTLGEVMDIDEEAFRSNRVTAKLYGYMRVPHDGQLIQTLKSSRAEGEESIVQNIASFIIQKMERDTIYLVGPGTTTAAILDALELPCTLLGIDAVCNGKLVGTDLTEKEILTLIDGKRTTIIVTIIGGQGYIFGRGNPQLSAQVIKKVEKENIMIVAPQSKLTGIGMRPLLIDTGEPNVNKYLAGYYRVIVGFERFIMRKAQ
jgi:predicted polyphosphate/ATP-dependent NAD kinase